MKIQNFANQVDRQEGFHDTNRALDALLWISLMFAPGARYARIIIVEHQFVIANPCKCPYCGEAVSFREDTAGLTQVGEYSLVCDVKRRISRIQSRPAVEDLILTISEPALSGPAPGSIEFGTSVPGIGVPDGAAARSPTCRTRKRPMRQRDYP